MGYLILNLSDVGWASRSGPQQNNQRLFKVQGFETCAFVDVRIGEAQPTIKRAAGFTLLEILLVLVLMGLAATMVMPRLSIGSSAQDLNIASERLLTLSQMAQQLALTEGRSIGLSVTRNEKSKEFSYEFLILTKGEWTPVKNHRILRGVNLSSDLTLRVEPGDSFWKEALAYEETSGSLLEDVVTEAKAKPNVYFWSSGEVTPARIRLCLVNGANGKQNINQCREVLFEETGEVVGREFMEG
ncbi:type II secretion system protein GspH [Endozoicomonas sp. (ex Bugula neritina AB1)]|nr:type II secretion system protein GspH [Endozoicomonas sp. (ex Bugula neritina AB1)]